MSIEYIDKSALPEMLIGDGLVLQGCGGDLEDWLDGINELFTDEGILRNGTSFSKAYAFTNDDLHCLMFPLDDADLDLGKLSAWRLNSREVFGGMWLSDYVYNYIVTYEPKIMDEEELIL